tara:strand:+ start:295 stop:651 length:357 start_codon:yes stop_codon:yes gene_type:complete
MTIQIKNINSKIEYLSLALILSYFFVHKITLVLIGLIISSYTINKNFLHKFFISETLLLAIEKANKNLNVDKKFKWIKSESKKTAYYQTKESTLKLAEEVEELGYIPKLEKEDKDKVS